MKMYKIFGKSKNKQDGDIFKRWSYFIPIIGFILMFIKPPVTDDAGFALGLIVYMLVSLPLSTMWIILL